MAVDNAAKIAALQAILESGARTISVDGLSTTYRSRDEILAEISRLKESDTENGYVRRRRVMNINLGGF